MATIDILLQEARINSQNSVSKHEMRDKSGQRGFLAVANVDSESMLGRATDPNSARYAIERLHEDRSAKIVVSGNYGVQKQVSRSCVLTSVGDNAALVDISKSTIVYNASIDMNEFSFPEGASMDEMLSHRGFQEVMQGKMIEVDRKIMDDKNEICKAGILAMKTPSTAFETPEYATTGDALQIPNTAELDALNQIQAQMFYNKFNPVNGLYVVAQPTAMPSFRRQNNDAIQFKGSEIARANESWMYDNVNYGFDHTIAPVAGVKYVSYAIAPNSIGVVSLIPVAMRKGYQFIPDTTPFSGKAFETVTLPISGDEVGVYRYSDCDGGKAVKLYMQISVDFGVVTAYNSDPVNNPSGVIEAHVLRP